MGRTYNKIEGQYVDQTLHTVAAKEREEIKGTIKQKMAKRHNKEGGNHLKQESNRQKAMEDIDGGLHPAVDGQSLGEGEGENINNCLILVFPVWVELKVLSLETASLA